MSYVDALTRVMAAQAFTATGVSASSYDLSADDPDIGAGEPLGFAITVGVAADSTTGDETYQFNVVDDDDAALGSVVVLAEMLVLAADLLLGGRVKLPVPMGQMKQRYLGVQVVLGGTTPSITVSADMKALSMISGSYRYYPLNYTIS